MMICALVVQRPAPTSIFASAVNPVNGLEANASGNVLMIQQFTVQAARAEAKVAKCPPPVVPSTHKILNVEFAGSMALVIVQKFGGARTPVQLPNTVLAAALLRVKLRFGFVVGFVTRVVNNGGRLPAEKLCTVAGGVQAGERFTAAALICADRFTGPDPVIPVSRVVKNAAWH